MEDCNRKTEIKRMKDKQIWPVRNSKRRMSSKKGQSFLRNCNYASLNYLKRNKLRYQKNSIGLLHIEFSSELRYKEIAFQSLRGPWRVSGNCCCSALHLPSDPYTCPPPARLTAPTSLTSSWGYCLFSSWVFVPLFPQSLITAPHLPLPPHFTQLSCASLPDLSLKGNSSGKFVSDSLLHNSPNTLQFICIIMYILPTASTIFIYYTYILVVIVTSRNNIYEGFVD